MDGITIQHLAGNEEFIGGIVAMLVTFYGVYKKMKADNVESVNQRAEIGIIEALTKQRDDAIELSEKYKTKIDTLEREVFELKKDANSAEISKNKLVDELAESESKTEMLSQLVEYLSETVSIARQSIESNDENN
jgi:uncharacterized coiled-coil DUF342 family protein